MRNKFHYTNVSFKVLVNIEIIIKFWQILINHAIRNTAQALGKNLGKHNSLINLTHIFK